MIAVALSGIVGPKHLPDQVPVQQIASDESPFLKRLFARFDGNADGQNYFLLT